MVAGGAPCPACLRSSGAQGFQRGDVAPQRCGLFACGVGPERSASVAGARKALRVCLGETVGLMRAAVACAGGAVFLALGRQCEDHRPEVVEDNPVVRGDRRASTRRKAGFDLGGGGAEVGDQGGAGVGHGGGSVGELHRFGARTIALKQGLS